MNHCPSYFCLFEILSSSSWDLVIWRFQVLKKSNYFARRFCLKTPLKRASGTRDIYGFGSTTFKFEYCVAWNEVWIIGCFFEDFKMVFTFDGCAERMEDAKCLAGGGVELRVWERRQIQASALEICVVFLNYSNRFWILWEFSPSMVRIQFILAELLIFTVCDTVSWLVWFCIGRIYVVMFNMFLFLFNRLLLILVIFWF